MTVIQDIPKLYTALAEWLACLVFVLLLHQRYRKQVTACILAGTLVLLCIIQHLIGIAPIWLWIPGMVVALVIMYGCIVLSCHVTLTDAGFYWAFAFITAEFTASLEWQLYSFFEALGWNQVPVQILFLVAIYGGVYAFFFLVERKKLSENLDLKVSVKETYSSAVIAIGAFLISNISYVNPNTPLSGRMSTEIFYIRTLVDLAGVIMLGALQDRWYELRIKQDFDAIESLLLRQYDQYRQSRESIELINRKYHDLKHQIGIIRLETNADKREAYLRQMESGVQGYEIFTNSGNDILDTILTSKQMYCQQHQIHMNVVADGRELSQMDVMDICSIFGNALDNAIESVEKLDNPDKRLIKVAVFRQNALLMIRVENYYETPLKREQDTFRTTKQDQVNHGYGIKSIRYVAEKYGGGVDISTEDNWFRLKVLLPIAEG